MATPDPRGKATSAWETIRPRSDFLQQAANAGGVYTRRYDQALRVNRVSAYGIKLCVEQNYLFGAVRKNFR